MLSWTPRFLTTLYPLLYAVSSPGTLSATSQALVYTVSPSICLFCSFTIKLTPGPSQLPCPKKPSLMTMKKACVLYSFCGLLPTRLCGCERRVWCSWGWGRGHPCSGFNCHDDSSWGQATGMAVLIYDTLLPELALCSTNLEKQDVGAHTCNPSTRSRSKRI